jgi:hypothetical protein
MNACFAPVAIFTSFLAENGRNKPGAFPSGQYEAADALPSEGVICIIRPVFWLSVFLARPSQSVDQWYCGVVSITAAGAARGLHPLPYLSGKT